MTMLVANDAAALKLHMAGDGVVWFADGVRAPVASGMQVPAFVGHLRARKSPFVRIIGSHINAILITAVYPLCRKGGRLEVVSPLVCETACERADPQIALHQMRNVMLAPSLGGWHQVTARDYPAYALVAQFNRNNRVNDHVRELLYAHPAWPALQFINGIAPDWAACVLAFITDPRWYIDPEHPSRVGRLRSYMGALPRWQVEVAGDKRKSPAAIRCSSVLLAWKSNGLPEGDLGLPGSFLWRIYHAAGGGLKGNVKASQKFLVFLRHTWLDALYAGTTCSGGASLFVPDMLFRSGAEIAAFKHHIGCPTK